MKSRTVQVFKKEGGVCAFKCGSIQPAAGPLMENLSLRSTHSPLLTSTTDNWQRPAFCFCPGLCLNGRACACKRREAPPPLPISPLDPLTRARSPLPQDITTIHSHKATGHSDQLCLSCFSLKKKRRRRSS